MMRAIRKYERAIYLVVTVVIVVSFSFFGTYEAVLGSRVTDQVAFTAVNGEKISKRDLDEMVLFLSTDKDDKLLYGGGWGPNFLNDGVIQNDFLQTGMADVLISQFKNDLAPDLASRLEREKRYTLYSHPQARFLGVESVWDYFIPEMTAHFNGLREQSDPVGQKALQHRTALYLGQKKLPPHVLRGILHQQEKQYGWLPNDETLEFGDLSLFGYHSLDDWFGPKLVRLVSEFIINSAILAGQKGYVVTKEEALADLLKNSEESYREFGQNPNVGVATSGEYYREQLRRMGMDQNQVVKIWQQVLLFRRLFQNVGNGTFVEAAPFTSFGSFAAQTALIDLYELPPSLQLASFKDLQALETYLNAVTKRGSDPVGLTSQFLSVDTVSRTIPELVQRRALVEVQGIDAKDLEAKVGVRQTWAWELDEKNWKSLEKQFPELGVSFAKTDADRRMALDKLHPETRGRVDTFAREAIVREHPEWIQDLLGKAGKRKETLFIHLKGGKEPLLGVKNNEKLGALLAAAPLSSKTTWSETERKAHEALQTYTDDKQHYYRISLLDYSQEPEILTFAEAKADGTLESMIVAQLEEKYKSLKEQGAGEKFKKKDGSWKEFAEVRDLLAEQVYKPLLDKIKASAFAKGIEDETMTSDILSSKRLFAHVRGLQKKISENPSLKEGLYREVAEPLPYADQLATRAALSSQWELEKKTLKVERLSPPDYGFNLMEAFGLQPGQWSQLHTPRDGDIAFFQLKQKETVPDPESFKEIIHSAIQQAKTRLSSEIQSLYMGSVLKDLQGKKAMTLDFMPSH